MVQIITIPNDNDQVMNKERQRIVPWARGHGWVYTGYNNESDHIAQIRRVSGGAAMQVLDFDCHGNPGVFDHTDSNTALQFGRNLAQLPGFSANTAIYLDACNTGLVSNFVSVPIAQTVADGARCTVYGTKGYMTGTYAEGNEKCYRGEEFNPPLDPYPGAQAASGRSVWIAFRPRNFQVADVSDIRTLTVGVEPTGRIWVGFDPTQPKEISMSEANSLTIDSKIGASQAICAVLDGIMNSDSVEFPQLRMAPDVTINYLHDDQVTVLDVFANGSLLRDRISGKTWRVNQVAEFTALIVQNLP